MGVKRRVRAFEQELGEFLEANRPREDLPDLTTYADDPVGFIRDILGGEPYAAQVEVAEAVRDYAQVTVRSCHAAGKDWLLPRICLHWTYSLGGTSILTGRTASQVEEILMRRELRDAFRASGLPGELHVRALRPSGDGKAAILARTASSVSGLQGFHDTRVLFAISEAQDPEIDHAFDAAFAVCTGPEDRILALGNPLEQRGRFYQSHRPSSGWHSIKIAASDIPNVQEGGNVVPGLLSPEGVERFRSEYGEGSSVYRSRVLAEFVEQADEGLFGRAELDAAAERHEAGEGGGEAGEGGGEETIVAVDPARYGVDRTALAVRRGSRVERFVTWGQTSTMQTAEKVRRELAESGVRPGDRVSGSKPVGRVVVDCVGLGAGVADRLRQEEYRVVDYKGSFRPANRSRFENLRSESYWRIRDQLESGTLCLPREERLFEELLAIRWSPTAGGKIALESKDTIRGRLGRSPDLADALSMALWPAAARRAGKVRVVHR